MDKLLPLIGTTGIIYNSDNSSILLGYRHDFNHWEFPGGRLNPGESVAECVEREVMEETGLEVNIITFVGYFEHQDRKKDGPRWLNMVFQCDCDFLDELQIDLEPDKFCRWKWFNISYLPLDNMWDVASRVFCNWLIYHAYKNPHCTL